MILRHWHYDTTSSRSTRSFESSHITTMTYITNLWHWYYDVFESSHLLRLRLRQWYYNVFTYYYNDWYYDIDITTSLSLHIYYDWDYDINITTSIHITTTSTTLFLQLTLQHWYYDVFEIFKSSHISTTTDITTLISRRHVLCVCHGLPTRPSISSHLCILCRLSWCT